MGIMLSNLSAYNISTESELSDILSNFNSEFLFTIIQNNIDQRLDYYQPVMTNIVASYEQNFKQLLAEYPDNKEYIQSVRNDNYIQIINILCSKFNLTPNISQIQDLYSSAYYLYKFFISDFKTNIINFFANFIIKERNGIYESLHLAEFKKSKDTSTLYNKKVFKNTKLAIIASNLDYVLDNLSNIDIPFDNLLNIIYLNDKNTVKTIEYLVTPNGDIYKELYINAIKSSLRPLLLTDIRLKIQSLSINEDINILNM